MADYPVLARFLGEEDALNKQRRLLDQELQVARPPIPNFIGRPASVTGDTENNYERVGTIPAHSAYTATTALTNKTAYLFPIYLNKGDTITDITFACSSQGMSAPLFYAFALLAPALDASNLSILAYTEDGAVVPSDLPWYDTTWPADTPKTLRLTEDYEVQASGTYYLALGSRINTGVGGSTTVKLAGGSCPLGVFTTVNAPPLYAAGPVFNTYAQFIDPASWTSAVWTYYGYWALGFAGRWLESANSIT